MWTGEFTAKNMSDAFFSFINWNRRSIIMVSLPCFAVIFCVLGIVTCCGGIAVVPEAPGVGEMPYRVVPAEAGATAEN
jgi:hypothetical protein